LKIIGFFKKPLPDDEKD